MSDKKQTVARHLVRMLWQLGAREAWGVCGREIATIWSALLETAGSSWEIATRHSRHENGAGFAAIGSWIQTARPTVLFVTTGPGLTNVITSLETARATGATLIMLSPLTPLAERGRLGIQATGPSGFANPDLYTPGRIFDHVTLLESGDQLATLAGQLAAGLTAPGGFMAHIAVPTDIQPQPTELVPVVPDHSRPAPGVTPDLADELVALFAEEPFGIWVGWGARHHAKAIRRLLDVTGAPAICSPRGLGVLDGHPCFLGSTGNGSRLTLPDELKATGIRRLLVLGTRLGEATSGWDLDLVPPSGFVHVDLDPSAFAAAYPQVATVGVQADVGAVVRALLDRSTRLVKREPPVRVAAKDEPEHERTAGVVHPVDLMAAIQRVIVNEHDLRVIADASSAMFWAARHLAFKRAGRFFVEGHFGAMGQAGAIVVGVASGRGTPAVAISGDGSLHMQDEINTAVRYGIPAIWIVLNDSGLGIVRAGMTRTGRVHDADFPATDFAAVAREKGAEGVRVTDPDELDAALRAAVEAGRPFVVDVVVDPTAIPPIEARTKR